MTPTQGQDRRSLRHPPPGDIRFSSVLERMNAPLTASGTNANTGSYDGFDERPFLVFWEITRACALACRHCRAEAQPHRHPDELNREQASRLIQQLAELNPPMLILTGGDPLMRRDALDLVREATAAGLGTEGPGREADGRRSGISWF